MRGPAKLASYLGIGMVLGGFVLIALSWNGAAGFDSLAQQFPYLLSGGLGGLGLILSGAVVMFVQAQREIDAEEALHYERVISSLRHTAAALRGGAPAAAPRAAGGSVKVVAATAVVADQPTVVTEGSWAPDTGEALVVAGRSSFHDATCHLVNTRDDLDLLSRSDAVAASLKPCRVCKP